MARLSLDDLLANCGPAVRKLNSGLFPAGRGAPAPQLEPRDLPRPLAASAPQNRDTRKRLVRIKSFRVRLLDEDNLCAKFHVDSLRYAGLLPGDDPNQARIQVSQEKVAHRHQERTEIFVEIILD